MSEKNDEYSKKYAKRFVGDKMPEGNGFNIPYVANIPVEQMANLNEQASQEITYIALKRQKTQKKFNDASSKLRKVADYLSAYFGIHFLETLSYSKIARDLGLSEAEVKNIVCELAGWYHYPLVFIRTPNKSGHFQVHSKSLEDTEKWMTMQERNIASRQERLDKTKEATSIKRSIKKKQKAKAKIQVQEE